jgi:methylthioribose-1-phosphate isomerase
MLPTPIAWTTKQTVRILDQTLLPTEERYLDLESVSQVAEAITVLRVRGAPLIGIAAAMGATLAVRPAGGPAANGTAAVLAACDLLQATRPTAVNLAWALGRIRRRARAQAGTSEELHRALVEEATAIWDEDRMMCTRIGQAGLALVPEGATVLTHCNAGILATGGIGTALAPIYCAHAEGRRVSVVADETRPLLQGSRLTAWELTRAGIPTTVIADNMAASRLRAGGITCVIVGADRIARNGDVANKIGTYSLAIAARAHRVPFYVAAPRSTFDPATPNGGAIPIEERNAGELRGLAGTGTRPTAPEAASIWNPAFDVTPAELIAGYITDAGLLTREQLGRLDGAPVEPSGG